MAAAAETCLMSGCDGNRAGKSDHCPTHQSKATKLRQRITKQQKAINATKAKLASQQAQQVSNIAERELLRGEAEAKKDEDDIIRCPICLLDFDDFSQKVFTSCKHPFHEDCITQWRESGSASCPSCRGNIDDDFEFVVEDILLLNAEQTHVLVTYQGYPAEKSEWRHVDEFVSTDGAVDIALLQGMVRSTAALKDNAGHRKRSRRN